MSWRTIEFRCIKYVDVIVIIALQLWIYWSLKGGEIMKIYFVTSNTPVIKLILEYFSHQAWHCHRANPGRGTLPYLGMIGRYHIDDARSCDFQSNWVPILRLDQIDPLFLQKKISLSLLHLVPEILGSKADQRHYHVYLTVFKKHFSSIFTLIVDPIDPHIHWC